MKGGDIVNFEEISIGLCEGRHEIPEVKEYIFPKGFFTDENDMFDYDRMGLQILKVLKMQAGTVRLYVTGFTLALVSVINFCCANLIPLVLMHFDKSSNSYKEQVVYTAKYRDLLEEGGYVSKRQ